MPKKAYKIYKKGDYYILPAGYAGRRYHEEIRTMDRNRAMEIMNARKTLSLKTKYPEIKSGINAQKQQQNPHEKRLDWKLQELKDIPDYIQGGKHLLKLVGVFSPKQVAEANESHYKHEGYVNMVKKVDKAKSITDEILFLENIQFALKLAEQHGGVKAEKHIGKFKQKEKQCKQRISELKKAIEGKLSEVAKVQRGG